MFDVDLSASDDASLRYLGERLDLVTDRLIGLSDAGPAPSVGSWSEGLTQIEAAADRVESEGPQLVVRRIAHAFGLDHLALDVLLLSLAAELHPHVRASCVAAMPGGPDRMTVGLALRSLGVEVDPRAINLVLSEKAPLVRHHLVSIERLELPLAERVLRVPDRVVRALLGIPGVDPLLRSMEAPLVPVPIAGTEEVARAIGAGVRAVYIRERPALSGHAFAASVLDHLGIASVGFDLRRAGPDHHPYGLAAAAAREGGLLDAAVVVGPIDSLVSRDIESLVPLLDNPWPVLMIGSLAWEPTWSRAVPLVVEASRPEPSVLASLWSETFERRQVTVADDAQAVIDVLRLTPEQTVRAAVAAQLAAAADGSPVGGAHVRIGARNQSAGRLEQLADRIEPGCRFDDLVLPPSLLDQVRQVAERGRHRDRVLDDWGMGGPGSRGRGITALFAGDSGTGKTLSAEAIAGELGVDLYVIDLSTVVDKYIGETEKNLGRVFDEAEGINGVLFFDEADALFGKRSDTSDAKDRYANVEVAYLLQRMERFDGVAILATNLRSNIDDAFTRRLDVIVHFTVPDVAHRALLWRRHLPPSLPMDDDIDVEFLAGLFEISGGVIRNIALTAAYRAAQRGTDVSMGDLVRATYAEYIKMGRLFDTNLLGSYASELDVEA